jgi:hypothetical protein
MNFRIPDALWLTLVSLALFAGCPSGGFFGRYVFLNGSKEPVHDFTISVGSQQASWKITEPGQGWIAQNMSSNITKVDVSWTGKSGETLKMQIDFTKAVGYRHEGDLIIQFDEGGSLNWCLAPKSINGAEPS